MEQIVSRIFAAWARVRAWGGPFGNPAWDQFEEATAELFGAIDGHIASLEDRIGALEARLKAANIAETPPFTGTGKSQPGDTGNGEA